ARPNAPVDHPWADDVPLAAFTPAWADRACAQVPSLPGDRPGLANDPVLHPLPSSPVAPWPGSTLARRSRARNDVAPLFRSTERSHRPMARGSKLRRLKLDSSAMSSAE